MSNVILSRENFECKYLDWDTEYFGVKSARVNLFNVVSESEQEEIINFCSDYSFVTISNIDNQNENNIWIGTRTNAFLTDINLQFSKTVEKNNIKNGEGIYIENNFSSNDNIISLAKNTFLYSRFYNDPNLPIDKARSIYVHWTKSAFYKKDKYFAYYIEENNILGYILFSFNNIKTIIELIAVNVNARGKQIGKKLIFALENYLYSIGKTEIVVGTQCNNDIATNFYLSVGFKYKYCRSIYHLWK